MSLTSGACDGAIHYLAALEVGRLACSGQHSLGRHLLECVDCQIFLAVSVVSWDRAHNVPRPPQCIERWRAVALHLFSSGESEDDDDAGYVAHPDEKVWWWRFETMQLEELAVRTAWSLDGDQDGRLRRWLAQIDAMASTCGGLDSEETEPDGKVRKVCECRRKCKLR